MTASPLHGRTVSLHTRLERELQRALRGDVEGVHQARVATRRLREAVGALKPLLPRGTHRRSRRVLRRLTRALGPIRELDVTRARLGSEAAALGWSRTATTRVDTFLVGLRRTAFADGVRVLEKTASAGAFRELLDAVKALEQNSAIAELRAVAAARRRRRALALADGLAGLGRLYVPDHLHAVRIAVKQLRYALEWEAALSRRTWSRERRRLEDMQDVLGEWHDLVILQLYVERATHTLARRVVPGASLMSAEMERQCRQLHARILTDVPRLASLARRTRA